MSEQASILELAAAIHHGCPRTASAPRRARRFSYDKKTGQVVEDRAPRERANPRYPRVLYSLGGMAQDRDELARTLAERGAAAEVTEEGDPVATSDVHRRKIARALGYASPDSFLD